MRELALLTYDAAMAAARTNECADYIKLNNERA